MRSYPEILAGHAPPPGWTHDLLLDYVHKVLGHLNLTTKGTGYKSYEAMDAWRVLERVMTLPPYGDETLRLIRTEGRRLAIPHKGLFYRWLRRTFSPDHPLWLWFPPEHRPTHQ